jgi:multidrug resistance protein, MATE family
MGHQFTVHKDGSVRELWFLAYPMVLAFLSGNMMMFADRLFLAHYSIAAMNAAATAGMMVMVFQYGAASISSIAEVFVGQFNGAKEYRRVAAPVWQMLWFSLAMSFLFFGIAEWGGPYLLSQYHYIDYGLPYYQWLLYFGVAAPVMAALTSFFVGIGKTRCIMFVMLAGNLLNVFLDVVFIFGVSGIMEPMGTKGAAIATGLSQMVQVFILGYLFLSYACREKYGTALWRFERALFFRCLKVGLPPSIGHIIEWSAWAVIMRLMALAGEYYLSVVTIGQSLYILVVFSIEGLQKAVTSLAANRIGSGHYDGIRLVWRSAIKLLFLFAIPLAVLMLGYPDFLIRAFLSKDEGLLELPKLIPLLQITAAGVFVYYLVDGFTWICIGILTAAEDTWFIMWVNGLTAWLCALFPILLFIVYWRWSPAWYFFFIAFYGACNAIIFYRRLRAKPWNKGGLFVKKKV